MGDLRVERDDLVAVVTLDRPAKRNALTDDLIAELSGAFDALEEEDQVRCVLLRGAGEEAFSAGYDLAALPAGEGREPPARLHDLFDRVEAFPYPVVACLRGYAVGGGCELALACDLRLAGDDLRMGMPPARIGLVYPLPGYARFLRTVGLPAAKEVFLTGRLFGAEDCLRLGLVHRVVSAPAVEAEALALAREIGTNAPLSLRGSKRVLNRLARQPALSPEEKDELATLFARSLASDDLIEGKRAFAERRKPRFSGR